MKKLVFHMPANPRSLLTLFLSLMASAFLLQSCCFGPVGFAKTPCNCNDKKPVYAVNNKSGATTINETAQTKPKMVQQDPSLLYTSSATVNTQNTAVTDILQKKNVPMRYEKKLPLGIQGIRSHIIAGPNLSFKSSNEDDPSGDYKKKSGTGFQFGFGSTLSFSSKFAVSTGLIFKKNNASEVLSYSTTGEPGSGGSTQEYESKYSYSYLSIPILAEFRISDQLTAMAGPQVNFLTGATVKSSGYGNTEKTDIKDYSVKTGVSVQAGIKFSIPKSPVAVQVVYDHRLSRLNENSESYYPGSSYDTPAWHMKDVSLSVVCDICNLMKMIKN
jgi:Outer membrane protein beta-barrel domain